MGSPGWRATVKRSGTSTQFTDEAASLVSGKTYQIDDETKQVWDREQPVTVKDDGVVVDSSNIEFIDYLFGKVTFASGYTVQGAVTISGNYLPMQSVAGANSYTLNQTAEILDDTDFDTAKNTGYRSRIYGLQDVSATISRWDDLSDYFKTVIDNGEVVVLEIRPGEGMEFFRGYMVVESSNRSGDVAALESEELSFQLDGDGAGKAFSWGN